MRIKTEKEFLKEFGEDWRAVVDWNYRGKMDHLFGVELSEQDTKFFEESIGEDPHLCSPSLVWRINRKMLVESVNRFLSDDEPQILLDQNN